VRQCGPETHDALRLNRRFLKAGYAVDNKTLDATAPDSVKQSVSELVQNILADGIPEDFYVTALLRRGEIKAHRRCLKSQPLRWLVTAEQRTRFAPTRTGQKMQTKGGLAAPDGPTNAVIVAVGIPPANILSSEATPNETRVWGDRFEAWVECIGLRSAGKL
jgi:hypothetical protein